MLLFNNLEHIDSLHFKQHGDVQAVGTLMFEVVNQLHILDFRTRCIRVILLSCFYKFNIMFMCLECV